MRPQPGSSDRPLTYFALAGIAVSLGLLATDRSPFGAGIAPEKSVGFVSRTLGSVQRRHQGSLVWRTVYDGARLFEGDSIFTGPGASGAFRLEDGSVLEIDESSLIVLEHAGRRDTDVRLEEGRVRGESATAELRMHAGKSTALLGRNAIVDVAIDAERTEIFSAAGPVMVSPSGKPAVALDPGSEMRITGGDAIAETFSLRLTAPDNGAFVRHRGNGAPLVKLTWRGKDPAAANVRLACGMESVRLIAVSTTSNELDVTTPESGVCRWRVLDANGHERSEERRFAVVEDRPPVPLRPVADELVVAPSGDALLAWTRVNGAERYRVELSTDPTFETPSIARDVEKAEQLLLSLPASEMRWHWRVRGLDGGPLAPWSPPETFRMTTVAGSEAPTRLDAEVRFDAVP